MPTTRPAAVAGSFYPADPRQLLATVRQLLAEADPAGKRPKAIIAPHAGYVYSGPIAASAYARLRQGRGQISRVVLLGPAHRVGFRGLAVSSATTFATPLGNIPIDRPACASLAALPFVHAFDQAHALEHSLEVHLPFLQEVLVEFSLVPIVVGDAAPAEVAAVLEALWGGDETLIVISSDLSHYHDYATARRLDAATSKAIEALRLEDIGYDDACGRLPISGLLIAARQHGLSAQTIDLRNSGDTAGSKDQVVGYGAYVFEQPAKPAGTLDAAQQRQLLELARASIRHGLDHGRPLPVDLASLPQPFKIPRASFATLEIDGQLRGCIGSLEAHRPLAEDIAHNAYAAAFQDPRFPPLRESELARLDIHLSLLTPAEPMVFQSEQDLLSQLRPGVDGLILVEGGRRGTFLPSVWEQLPNPVEFLEHLKLKAGLPKGYWSDSLKVYRYTSEVVD
jgi:AmmeMemoRadiSam system protein B/AmmeMemoRadiSam system protein A